MYKITLSCIVLIFLLLACTDNTVKKQEPTALSQQQVSSENLTVSKQKEKYQKLLEDARDAQEKYIQSLPENERGSVQTSLSAMQNKAIELQQENPKDHALIEEVLTELTQLGSKENKDEP